MDVKFTAHSWSTTRVDAWRGPSQVDCAGLSCQSACASCSFGCVYSLLLLLFLPLVHRCIVMVARHARPHSNTRNCNIIRACSTCSAKSVCFHLVLRRSTTCLLCGVALSPLSCTCDSRYDLDRSAVEQRSVEVFVVMTATRQDVPVRCDCCMSGL